MAKALRATSRAERDAINEMLEEGATALVRAFEHDSYAALQVMGGEDVATAAASVCREMGTPELMEPSMIADRIREFGS